MIFEFLKTIHKNTENHEICRKVFSLRYFQFNCQFLAFMTSACFDRPFNSGHKILNFLAMRLCPNSLA